MKPRPFRVGDIVRIVNPILVIRVGYDFTHYEACKLMWEQHRDKVNSFLQNIYNEGSIHHPLSLFFDKHMDADGLPHKGTTERKIVEALAYSHIKRNMKCGNKRKLFTETREELLNRRLKIMSRKSAWTGLYDPPSGGYDSYSGEWDYEPGGLHKAKHHVLLTLEHGIDVAPYMHLPAPFYSIPIIVEACNVEHYEVREDEQIHEGSEFVLSLE